jgi:hypothetical protein
VDFAGAAAFPFAAVDFAADFDDLDLLGAAALPVFLPAAFFVDAFLLVVLPLLLALTAGLVKPSCAGVAPIRYNVEPQTEHSPVVMGVARALNPAWGLTMSRFVLHLKQ